MSDEELTYKEVRERFIARDNGAITDFQNSGYSNTTEGRLSFLSARLEDTMGVLLYVLRRLEEAEIP